MSMNISGFNLFNNNSVASSTINKNSKQYKALEEKGMISSILENEIAMTPEQKLIYETFGGRNATIKNMMRLFDSDGDMINQFGVGGMDVTGKPAGYGQEIISVSEESRQEMFESVKRDFIQGKGLVNGDTTKRSDVFEHYQKKRW